MPIPASPDRTDVAPTVLRLFRQIHDQVREEIKGLDDGGLNWVPTHGANSVATIVTHMVGSEAETLHCLAGVVYQRDRDGEFSRSAQGVRDVLAELDRADALIIELAERIDHRRLRAVFPLPTLPKDERRSGLTWLVGNYGHAREHVGQIQLTKQLYLQEAEPEWTEGLAETQDPRT